MKILWVTPYFMYPLHFGRNIRSFKILENLNAVHDITLVSFTREAGKKISLGADSLPFFIANPNEIRDRTLLLRPAMFW